MAIKRYWRPSLKSFCKITVFGGPIFEELLYVVSGVKHYREPLIEKPKLTGLIGKNVKGSTLILLSASFIPMLFQFYFIQLKRQHYIY